MYISAVTNANAYILLGKSVEKRGSHNWRAAWLHSHSDRCISGTFISTKAEIVPLFVERIQHAWDMASCTACDGSLPALATRSLSGAEEHWARAFEMGTGSVVLGWSLERSITLEEVSTSFWRQIHPYLWMNRLIDIVIFHGRSITNEWSVDDGNIQTMN